MNLPTQNRKTILIVDDEMEIREMLGEILSEDYRVQFAQGGQEAIDSIDTIKPSLVVLDAMMPKVNGWSVCEAIRSNPTTREIPIIFLSAVQDAESRVRAFNLGADDFLAKPFHTGELIARINARLKRSAQFSSDRNSPTPDRTLSFLDLELDLDSGFVRIQGARPIKLSDIETRIMEFLIRNTNALCSREALREFVWEGADASHRNLDPHISNLRKKLSASRAQISAAYGRGYTLSSNTMQ